jgi:hypothetical protein
MAPRRKFFLLALLFLLPICGMKARAQTGQAVAAPPPTTSILIRLEQKKGEKTSLVLPGHVFDVGDVVRFRLTSGADGYLYVVNQGSSGTYSTLFPAGGGHGDNRLRKSVDFLVPATEDGWFAIDGPPGFDIVYFLLSPTPLSIAEGEAKSPASPMALPDNLKPRCNDAIFQARGECIDNTAGPAPLPRGVPLPPQISTAAPKVSRDIVFTSDNEDNTVKASSSATVPVVYTFRLAHH